MDLSSAVNPQGELLGKWFLGTFCQNKKYLPLKVKAKKNINYQCEKTPRHKKSPALPGFFSVD